VPVGRSRHLAGRRQQRLQAFGAASLGAVDATRQALRRFSGWEHPGRLNVVRESRSPRYDYAHNPDCYRALVAFIDRWPVAGRRSSWWLSGAFPPGGQKSPDWSPDISPVRQPRLAQLLGYRGELPVGTRLIAHGVAPDAVSVVSSRAGDAVAGQGGDLVVLCTTASMKRTRRSPDAPGGSPRGW
jgi:hypothetical protein